MKRSKHLSSPQSKKRTRNASKDLLVYMYTIHQTSYQIQTCLAKNCTPQQLSHLRYLNLKAQTENDNFLLLDLVPTTSVNLVIDITNQKPIGYFSFSNKCLRQIYVVPGERRRGHATVWLKHFLKEMYFIGDVYVESPNQKMCELLRSLDIVEMREIQPIDEKLGDDQLYCLCQKKNDASLPMIFCDTCKNWFHLDCVNLAEDAAVQLKSWSCPLCVIKRKRKMGVAFHLPFYGEKKVITFYSEKTFKVYIPKLQRLYFT